MEKGLFQSDVARILDLTEIISFLGYVPFTLDCVTFRGKMRAFRVLHGETTQQFGDRFGVHSTTVQAWEKGESPPAGQRLAKLQELLKTVKPLS